MAEDKWIEVEYLALQDQMAKLLDIGQTAIRFCLPAAAAVYALPVLVQKTQQVYLWALCTGLAGLLITAMVHTFCACVTGGRRIGAYIKEAIEPRTNNGLKWEAVLFEWEKREAQASINPLLAVSAGALLANVAASAGAGAIFLRGSDALIPTGIAVIFVVLSLPTAFKTSRAANSRERCVEDVRGFLASLQDNRDAVASSRSQSDSTIVPVAITAGVIQSNSTGEEKLHVAE